jgi:hypothetical protein
MTEASIPAAEKFPEEVRARFGLLPNFFRTASSAPGLIEEMWGFAKSGYLDNPLPSVFKERLFVHLSRFCEIRYCIVRHVGFLIGEGNPSGDATALPQTIEQTPRVTAQTPARCRETRASSCTSREATTGRCRSGFGIGVGKRSI